MASSKKEGTDHVKVAVRIRPLNGSEAVLHSSVVEGHSGRRTVKVVSSRAALTGRACASLSKDFGPFDYVYGPKSRQKDIYRELVAPRLSDVLNGYNCTIFAYGQTGTGKTFTMEGERSEGQFAWFDDPLSGIIPRSLHQIFDTLNAMQDEYTVRVSYVELYNEELNDLLGTGNALEPGKESAKIRLFEDPERKGSVRMYGVEEVLVKDKDQVYEILQRGSLKRQTASTRLNQQSSVHDNQEVFKHGKLCLVDLAGSENIGRSGAMDRRAKEAGSINQSLLTLGRVISALIENKSHIPYRESKLTRILMDSLGGRSLTTIIATLSPSASNYEETVSTLEYAMRAKQIKNHPEANCELSKQGLLKDFSREMDRMRKDLVAARDKNGITLAKENYEEMLEEMRVNQQRVEELTEEFECAQMQIKRKIEDMEYLEEHHRLSYDGLQMAKERLDDKKNKLERTRSQVAVLKHELCQEQYCSEELSVNVQVLRAQTMQVLALLSAAQQDNVLLHAKCECLCQVNVTNKNAVRTHTTHGRTELQYVDTSLTDVMLTQANALDRQLLCSNADWLVSVQSCVAELQTAFRTHRQHVHRAAATAKHTHTALSHQHNEHALSMHNTLTAHKECMGAVHVNVNGQVSGQMAVLCERIQSNQHQLDKTHTALIKQNDVLSSGMEQHVHSQQQHNTTATTHMQLMAQAQTHIRAELLATKEALNHENEEHAKHCAQLMQRHMQEMAELQSTHTTTTSALTQKLCSLDSKLTECSGLLAQSVQTMDSAHKDCVAWTRTQSTQAAQALHDTHTQLIQPMQAHMHKHTELCTTLTHTTNIALATATKGVDESCAVLGAECDKMVQCSADQQTTLDGLFASQSEALSQLDTQVTARSQQNITLTQTHTALLNQLVHSQVEKLASTQQSVSGQLQTVCDELQALDTDHTQLYSATGETPPASRRHSFADTLVPEPDRAELVQRFEEEHGTHHRFLLDETVLPRLSMGVYLASPGTVRNHLDRTHDSDSDTDTLHSHSPVRSAAPSPEPTSAAAAAPVPKHANANVTHRVKLVVPSAKSTGQRSPLTQKN